MLFQQVGDHLIGFSSHSLDLGYLAEEKYLQELLLYIIDIFNFDCLLI